MENAIDALKMAAAALIFIIAIGTSFSIFGKAKQTADSIITMRDKQAYLAAAELDNGILYTSSSAIQGETGLTADDVKTKFGVTTTGDRIVNINDIVSTLYRYSKEKYGVTIVKSNGDVLRRFDSATESLIINYKKIESDDDDDDDIGKYKNRLKKNTTTIYAEPDFSDLEGLYRVSVTGGSGNISCGAPWYGNDDEINRRIACELSGKTYTYNGQSFQRSSLLTELKNNTIVEVINEIDNSKYLKDGDGEDETTTDLLQQYNMPTIEIVYIIL